jgi:hypothetical protein
MTFDVTCNHHRKKKGKNTTRTIPFLEREVQGLSGFALANADPKEKKKKYMADYIYYALIFQKKKVQCFRNNDTYNFILYYTVSEKQPM